ncbi:hypothetical protein ROZALSC1DRAFT_23462 [Rozella allomycis CSF55]|uniref:Uncharacterized protein n=1 Tax=Rozella allomycis (strain CSF55) TaxID=988480 RepID=A0A4P9YIP8_ROZAC|nr:hypothetical protein ROZALSC1DRAFT_23462 [Rozella allomycis CSF55]
MSPWKSFKNIFKGKRKNIPPTNKARTSKSSKKGATRSQGLPPSYKDANPQRLPSVVQRDHGEAPPGYTTISRNQHSSLEWGYEEALPGYTTIDRNQRRYEKTPSGHTIINNNQRSSNQGIYEEKLSGYTTIDRSPNSRPFVNSKSDVSTTIQERYKIDSPDRLSPDDKIEVFRDYKKFLNNYKIDEISVRKVEEIANIYSSARKLRMIKSDVQPIIDQIQAIIDKRDHLKMYPPEPRKLKGMSDFEFRRLATEYKAQREYVLHTLLKLYDTQNKLKRLPTDYAKLDLIPSYRRKGDVMTTIKNRYMAKSFNELTPKDQADLRNEYKNFIERESKPLDKHDYEGNVERARNVYNSALTLRLKADDIKPYLEEMTKRIEYNSWHLKKMDKDLADPSVSDNYKNGVKKERPIVAQETIDLSLLRKKIQAL